MTDTIFAHTLYDGSGDTPRRDQLITINKCRIASIHSASVEQAKASGARILPIIAPGFIDIQINGAGDVQFDETTDLAGLKKIAHAARQGGTAHILPTFITAHNRAFARAIDLVETALQRKTAGILGAHLEGPFLSPNRPGIHEASFLRAIEPEDLEVLCAPSKGVRLLTLAPECHRSEVIQQLHKAGVIVFAGHSEATYGQMAKAAQHGLSGATHLFNAMSQMTGREPAVVGAVLSIPNLYTGIIADGIHVAAPNLRIAAQMKPDHLCLVTDAMCTLAGTIDSFQLNGQTIYLRDGRLTNAEGTLAGAQLAMDQALQNMVELAGTSPAKALQMASTNPAHALGLQGELGYIREGYRASLSLLDDTMSAQGVIVDGAFFD